MASTLKPALVALGRLERIRRSVQRMLRHLLLRRAVGSRRTKERFAWLIDRWCASRTDIGVKSRMQNEWAGVHIKAGLGSLTLDKLDRDDISRWLEATAAAGKLSKRSLQIWRMVLRAVLADAVEEGLIRRSPAARVVLPKFVARPVPDKGVRSWDEAEIRVFLRTIADHRWAGVAYDGALRSSAE
jgi:hypothetical protein